MYCLWHHYAVYDAIWKETIAKNFKTEIYRLWAQKIPFNAIRQAKLCFWIDATSGPSRQFGAPFGSVGPPPIGGFGGRLLRLCLWMLTPSIHAFTRRNQSLQKLQLICRSKISSTLIIRTPLWLTLPLVLLLTNSKSWFIARRDPSFILPELCTTLPLMVLQKAWFRPLNRPWENLRKFQRGLCSSFYNNVEELPQQADSPQVSCSTTDRSAPGWHPATINSTHHAGSAKQVGSSLKVTSASIHSQL